MQRTTTVLSLTVGALLALGSLLPAQADDKKVNAAGTWTWSVPGRDGGPERKSTLKLKVDGDKVTGSIASPGRQGAEPRETNIEDGKLKGDEISFSVTREFNNNKMTQKFTGKISGNTITGKIEVERDGQTRSRDWEAKREGDKS